MNIREMDRQAGGHRVTETWWQEVKDTGEETTTRSEAEMPMAWTKIQ